MVLEKMFDESPLYNLAAVVASDGCNWRDS